MAKNSLNEASKNGFLCCKISFLMANLANFYIYNEFDRFTRSKFDEPIPMIICVTWFCV